MNKRSDPNGASSRQTDDQCRRDRPDENMRAMVQVAKELRQHLLDTAGIQAEIDRLSWKCER